jgi:hypothetical protein
LRRKLADVTNEDHSPNKRQRCGHDTDNESEGDDDPKKEMEDLARKFVIAYGLWLRHGIGTFKVELNEDFSTLAQHHFQNTNLKVQGQLSELMELLPDHLCTPDIFKGALLPKTVSLENEYALSGTHDFGYLVLQSHGYSTIEHFPSHPQNCRARHIRLHIQ